MFLPRQRTARASGFSRWPAHSEQGSSTSSHSIHESSTRSCPRARPLAGARGPRLFPREPLDPRIEHMILRAGAGALVGPLHLLDGEARAVAGRAPAVLGVVGEQARVELREAAAASAAGALGGKHLELLVLQDMN